ncbi:hypothetical protein JET18_08470 [Chryseobacterium sp. L7]|uniref:Uncharacterized protein n=1 Tax=Chryseobacterium endalhagicum TaxID=2797638 RepID=A0ABS1QE36_9FLAO|nr:hypothetical protein [Chryseobacterium endalhagicum]MBL1220868.1 hypothetical protein [Chryseobacterium endalhagicum]
MKKEILKQLRSEYERLEIKPSADLWDRMEQEMEDKPVLSVKKPFQWWGYAAAVLVLLSVGTMIYYYSFKTEFDYKKTDYIVKKGLDKKIKPVNSDPISQPVTPEVEPIRNEETRIVREDHKKVTPEKVLTPKNEEKINTVKIPEHKEQQIVIHQAKTINKDQEKTVVNSPDRSAMAEVKRSKSSYISSDDLLLGRELEKTRARSNRDNRKFGVINLDKIVPDVGNVTVLGVTVYLEDSK